eukprot:TRINITY_DN10291_c0_g3_i1.p1 TRINITY_DN10291_c0_g3~~TRINITY_DN10291_c0_g3_i1.p1  ORF type:complete len:603 (-),score=172.66 TRINITY_DN10291_c0_g3_i1:89-1897(-)
MASEEREKDAEEEEEDEDDGQRSPDSPASGASSSSAVPKPPPGAAFEQPPRDDLTTQDGRRAGASGPWSCFECGLENDAGDDECMGCGEERPDEATVAARKALQEAEAEAAEATRAAEAAAAEGTPRTAAVAQWLLAARSRSLAAAAAAAAAARPDSAPEPAKADAAATAAIADGGAKPEADPEAPPAAAAAAAEAAPSATEVSAAKIADDYIKIESQVRALERAAADSDGAVDGDDLANLEALRRRLESAQERLRNLAERKKEEEAAAAAAAAAEEEARNKKPPWYKRPKRELCRNACREVRSWPGRRKELLRAVQDFFARKKRVANVRIELLLRRRWRFRLEMELWRIAFENGQVLQPPPPPLRRPMRELCSKQGRKQFWQDLKKVVRTRLGRDPESKASLARTREATFSEADVVEAYQRMRPREPKLMQALLGRGKRIWTCTTWVCVVVFVALAYFALAFIVFFTSADFSVDVSGALLPNAAVLEPLATAGTVGLRTLSDYPRASLEELRGVRDVVFTHNLGQHVLQVSAVTRSAAGQVVLSGADGSAVRVEPDGSIYWWRKAFSEIRLRETELWRSAPQVYAKSDWLVGGAFQKQVVL